MDDEKELIDGIIIDNLQVLEAVWYDVKAPINPLKVIGIVTVRCLISGNIKKYIGLATGEHMIKDIVLIVTTGVPFTYSSMDTPPPALSTN